MPLGQRLRTWWQRLHSPGKASRRKTGSRLARLTIECLESRDCPAAESSTLTAPLGLGSSVTSSAIAPIPITTPTVITRPGYYQLQNSITVSSGVGITIAASDVTLDLNGFSIVGPGKANNQTIGIFASNRDRITIRNGNISSFFYGIYLSDNADYVTSRNTYFDQGGHIIEKVNFYGNTFRALRVEGVANVIRDNVFQDTGGTNVYRPAYVAAIETYGPGAVIQDNIIYNIRGSGYGILVSNLGSGTTIQRNIITAAAYSPHANFSANVEGLSSAAWTWAIAVQGATTEAIVSANTIVNYDFGIAYLAGARGLITGNVIEKTAIPFFAPSGPGPVVLAPDNMTDRRNFIVSSADGLIQGNGVATVRPAPRASSPSAPGSTSVRTISGPTIITQPGYYRLVGDIQISSGIAIEIRADDVYIDLNGCSLLGPATPNTTTIGIYANGRSRIHIRNGTIAGFQYGIYLADGADQVLGYGRSFTNGMHIIENVHLTGNTFRAIRVEGRGNIVRKNIIEDIGGSTLARPSFVVGIEAIGPGSIVFSNHVYAVRGQGAAIYITGPSSGTVVQGNTISRADSLVSNGYPPAIEGFMSEAEVWGIRVDASDHPVVVRENLLANLVYGIAFTNNGDGLLVGNVVTGTPGPYYLLGANLVADSSNYADVSPAILTSPTQLARGNGTAAPVARPQLRQATRRTYLISAPTTITQPGTYILTSDIFYRAASGAAITIAASNVILDLNGYAIVGPGTASNLAYGVYVRNQNRVTIRNGTIMGFQYGVYISDDADLALAERGFNQGGHLVEGLTLIGNTFRGMRIEGRGNVIRDNIVQDTGGTTVYSDPIVVGIESLGPGALIEGNRVYAIRGHGYGLAISGLGGGTIVRGNYLSNSALTSSSAYRPGTDGTIANANTYGIWVGDRNGEVVVSKNNIINFAVGIGWHPNSGGILSANNVTESRVAYYLPGRPVPRVVYAPTNSSDDPRPPVTVERDILPPGRGSAPSLALTNPTTSRFVRAIYGPTVIRQPGIYVLARDLVVSEGHGIIVRASDVVIDLNGHTIYGPNSRSTRSIGIYVENQSRVTIRNGTITGFLYGILISDASGSRGASQTGFSTGGHIVENLRLADNKFRGMRVEGRGSVIRNNLVMNTGGATLWPNAYAFAIEVIGPGALVMDNIVYNTYGMGNSGEGVGLSASSVAGGSLFVANVIANSGLTRSRFHAPWPGTSTSTWGIWVGDTTASSVSIRSDNFTSALIVNNVVQNYRYGITIHAWSQGLMVNNLSAGGIVPFYTPVRDRPRAIALDNNLADKSPKIFTVERKY